MGNATARRTLAQIVREGINGLGISQEEFGDRMGRSQEWVSKVLSGEIQTPRNTTLRRLAEVIDEDLAELYVAANLAKTKDSAKRIEQELATEGAPDTDALRDELVKLAQELAPVKLETGLRLLRALHESRTGWT